MDIVDLNTVNRTKSRHSIYANTFSVIGYFQLYVEFMVKLYFYACAFFF